jgi:superfamily II DNA/RNA helicase
MAAAPSWDSPYWGRSFDQMGVDQQLLASLLKQGFRKSTAIQDMAFAPIVSGSDVIVGSETGSGKTLAYLVPLFESIIRSRENNANETRLYPRTLVLVPGKELVQQVLEMATAIATTLNISVGKD